jgi:hypothetical protein
LSVPAPTIVAGYTTAAGEAIGPRGHMIRATRSARPDLNY